MTDFIKKLQNFQSSPIKIKEHLIDILWHNDFSIFLRKFGRFILREIRWIPVLWNQEEWDFEYIYDILEMKMKELKKDMSKDTWHAQKDVQKSIKQIEICIARLNRWRNWPSYYYYPMDDIYHKSTKNGGYVIGYSSEINEKQRLGANNFEQKNYDKFWEDFLKWHRRWWT